jgi:NAD(P)-dependent dehydrogenase (short-subunit alcohol dehydrogenase family)
VINAFTKSLAQSLVERGSRQAAREEIAPAFVFLTSGADSSYITGEVLTLLGGETTAG